MLNARRTNHGDAVGRKRRTWLHGLALAMVLVAQLLPCMIGMPVSAAETPAHCHGTGDDGGPPAGAVTASMAECRHCLLLSLVPAAQQIDIAKTSPDHGSNIDLLLPTHRRQLAAMLPLRIDKSHPPPLPALQSTLSRRVLLI